MEFTKQLKKDWISALESGVYKKSESANLYYNGCYCALGVFCMVSGIVKEGRDLLNGIVERPYDEIDKFITRNQVIDIYLANDGNEGDNFKAAIEVIKNLQTTN
jgi:hypothetical protein